MTRVHSYTRDLSKFNLDNKLAVSGLSEDVRLLKKQAKYLSYNYNFFKLQRYIKSKKNFIIFLRVNFIESEDKEAFLSFFNLTNSETFEFIHFDAGVFRNFSKLGFSDKDADWILKNSANSYICILKVFSFSRYRSIIRDILKKSDSSDFFFKLIFARELKFFSFYNISSYNCVSYRLEDLLLSSATKESKLVEVATLLMSFFGNFNKNINFVIG